jgi:hypothetical protein
MGGSSTTKDPCSNPCCAQCFSLENAGLSPNRHWGVARQVFGLRAQGRCLTYSRPLPSFCRAHALEIPVLRGRFRSQYRCGAAPDSHRIPSCRPQGPAASDLGYLLSRAAAVKRAAHPTLCELPIRRTETVFALRVSARAPLLLARPAGRGITRGGRQFVGTDAQP